MDFFSSLKIASKWCTSDVVNKHGGNIFPIIFIYVCAYQLHAIFTQFSENKRLINSSTKHFPISFITNQQSSFSLTLIKVCVKPQNPFGNFTDNYLQSIFLRLVPISLIFKVNASLSLFCFHFLISDFWPRITCEIIIQTVARFSNSVLFPTTGKSIILTVSLFIFYTIAN